MRMDVLVENLQILTEEFESSLQSSFLLDGLIGEDFLGRFRRDVKILIRKIEIIKEDAEKGVSKEKIRERVTDLSDFYMRFDPIMLRMIDKIRLKREELDE